MEDSKFFSTLSTLDSTHNTVNVIDVLLKTLDPLDTFDTSPVKISEPVWKALHGLLRNLILTYVNPPEDVVKIAAQKRPIILDTMSSVIYSINRLVSLILDQVETLQLVARIFFKDYDILSIFMLLLIKWTETKPTTSVREVQIRIASFMIELMTNISDSPTFDDDTSSNLVSFVSITNFLTTISKEEKLSNAGHVEIASAKFLQLLVKLKRFPELAACPAINHFLCREAVIAYIYLTRFHPLRDTKKSKHLKLEVFGLPAAFQKLASPSSDIAMDLASMYSRIINVMTIWSESIPVNKNQDAPYRKDMLDSKNTNLLYHIHNVFNITLQLAMSLELCDAPDSSVFSKLVSMYVHGGESSGETFVKSSKAVGIYMDMHPSARFLTANVLALAAPLLDSSFLVSDKTSPQMTFLHSTWSHLVGFVTYVADSSIAPSWTDAPTFQSIGSLLTIYKNDDELTDINIKVALEAGILKALDQELRLYARSIEIEYADSKESKSLSDTHTEDLSDTDTEDLSDTDTEDPKDIDQKNLFEVIMKQGDMLWWRKALTYGAPVSQQISRFIRTLGEIYKEDMQAIDEHRVTLLTHATHVQISEEVSEQFMTDLACLKSETSDNTAVCRNHARIHTRPKWDPKLLMRWIKKNI